MYDIRKIQEKALFCAVKAVSDDETSSEIVYGETGQLSAEDNAAWVKSAMDRLENRFDRSTVRKIRMNCQCGYGIDEKLALLKELIVSSSSLEEFANQAKAVEAGLFFRNGELYLQFPCCPCPMLADVDMLETDTWCQCTTGYSKVLFEKAFGCEVSAQLLKSVKMGDESCLQKIILHDFDWE